MKRSRFLVLALGLCLFGSAGAACRNEPPAPGDYIGKLNAARAAKDENFRITNDVIPADKKDQFLPLSYFPPDPDYNVPGVLKPAADSATLMMPTSTGQQREMRRVGSLEFTLKGQPMTLTAFVEAGARDMNRLFVPFSDMTSGTETYPAGRYLDLDRTATGVYEVDFNYAYHPYCLFNPTYDCPFPPEENRLKVPIHAGEKLRK
ncbi:MAG: DUF1684 domain-containing protein [Vicinamibacterales bacterium]